MKQFFSLFLISLFFFGCQKEIKDTYLYELNEVEADSYGNGKTKRKTEEQYIAILYANLFQKALSSNELLEIQKCIASIGDKEIAHEVVVSNFMNKSEVVLPENTAMRADINQFVLDTYKRFYVREPSVAERTWWKNYIQANPQVTTELVYVSFALSEEYLFY